MKITAAILAALVAVPCAFVSCGSKSSDSSSDSIIGKWVVDRGSYTLMGLSPEEISYFNSISMEFRDDGKYVMTLEYNFTNYISLQGGKCKVGGQETEYTYDGKTLSVGKLDFNRIGDPDPDSPYGEYTGDFLKNFFGENNAARIGFPAEGVSYAVEETEIEYTYDPQEKVLKQGSDSDESTVELDGDTLKITDKDGAVSILNRASQ